MNRSFIESYISFFFLVLAISSEPIYENIHDVHESIISEVVEPSDSRENPVTHTVNIVSLQKGKRKSLRGDTPSPPAKKRNRTSRLLRGSRDKKRNSDRKTKEKLRCENLTQIALTPIPETGTPKKGFQFFHSPSIRKLNKNSTPDEKSNPVIPLPLFSKEKNKTKSKKRLFKKSEISAPLESMHSPSIPDNPLRRLRPRK